MVGYVCIIRKQVVAGTGRVVSTLRGEELMSGVESHYEGTIDKVRFKGKWWDGRF